MKQDSMNVLSVSPKEETFQVEVLVLPQDPKVATTRLLLKNVKNRGQALRHGKTPLDKARDTLGASALFGPLAC